MRQTTDTDLSAKGRNLWQGLGGMLSQKILKMRGSEMLFYAFFGDNS